MARQVGVALSLLLSVTLGLVGAQNPAPVVNTTAGPIQGVMQQTAYYYQPYAAYLGIPYAEPPLGELRFKPPVPVKPWTEVRNTSQDADACTQIDLITGNFLGSEDCLYLNVYSNNVGGKELKPVLVWIYGGAYISGYSTSNFYAPDFFLEEGVILAALNYRLGVCGFLNLAHPDAMGNAGLKDQNLALRWVRDNIAKFGGDPNQVTLFGESAGAVSTGFHVLSPKSEGLFQRIIYQSGTPLCQWGIQTPQKAYSNALDLAKSLGYNGDTTEELLRFLIDANIDALVNATMKVDYGVLPFRPTVEDPTLVTDDSAMITQCPIKLYQTGNYYKVPTIIGRNADEMLFFLNLLLGNGTHKEAISNILSDGIGITGIANELLSEVSAFSINTIPDSWLQLFIRFFTDLFFDAPIDLTRELLSKTGDGNPIYYYLLQFRSQYPIHEIVGVTINGTSHVDDVGYLFNVDLLNAPTDTNHPLNVFRKKFVNLWANFAKYGNPTPPNETGNNTFGVTWLDSNPTGIQLDINTTSTMAPNSLDALAIYYKNLLPSLLVGETGCRA
ncbi:acetylcholinesterase-like [Nomia melanderi]|uniref:acetylcholinesterase-like n=1 Tax=Nomia melanderi TaxID=2448451 RepID=UPI001304499D|nr:cholinesterase 2-like [Nomia melanderi]